MFSCWTNRIFLHNAQSVKQPSELLFAQRNDFFLRSGPLKLSILETLGDEHEPILFPKQSFDDGRLSAAEQEEDILTRVQLHGRLNQQAQAVNAFAHIRVARADVHMIDAIQFISWYRELESRASSNYSHPCLCTASFVIIYYSSL